MKRRSRLTDEGLADLFAGVRMGAEVAASKPKPVAPPAITPPKPGELGLDVDLDLDEEDFPEGWDVAEQIAGSPVEDPLPGLDEDLPATGAPTRLEPGLYVVATPIGTLADITLRALDVLRRADVICCEDTRTSSKLLAHYGIAARKLHLSARNEESVAPHIVERVRAGEVIALISDAGTPGLSDPGARTVAAVREAGGRIVSIPGASSLPTAISVLGWPMSGFVFVGFLPKRPGRRRAALREALALGMPVLAFAGPHDVSSLADDVVATWPNARVAVMRELSKRFEEVWQGSPAEWVARNVAQPPRGEHVIALWTPDVNVRR